MLFLALFVAWDKRRILHVELNLTPRKRQVPVSEWRTAVPLAEVD